VEDSQRMRRLIRSLFAGAECVECGDGSEALDACRRHRPDWVLMDVQMPKLDGIVATRQITATFPQARVLMVTNYGSPQLRSAARAAGACGYVLKENLLELRDIIQANPDRSPKAALGASTDADFAP